MISNIEFTLNSTHGIREQPFFSKEFNTVSDGEDSESKISKCNITQQYIDSSMEFAMTVHSSKDERISNDTCNEDCEIYNTEYYGFSRQHISKCISFPTNIKNTK